MSKSQNIRSMHDDTVKFQIYNIERKIHKANEKRQEKISTHVEKNLGHSSKLDQTLIIKTELQDRKYYDTMNKVVLKHHNKMQKFKKDEKLDKEKKMYMLEKSKESDMLL